MGLLGSYYKGGGYTYTLSTPPPVYTHTPSTPPPLYTHPVNAILTPLSAWCFRCTFCRASLNLLLLDKPQLRGSTHYLETLSLSVAILAAALFVPGVNVVFQLLGATTSSLLCFIIPAYLGYKADCHKQGIGHAACIVGVLVLGCCIGVLGSAVTVQGLLWPQG